MCTGGDTSTFRFDADALDRIAAASKAGFATASPFQHAVLDGVVDPSVLDDVLVEFPEPGQVGWQQFDQATEVKLALADTSQMGPVTRNLLAQFNNHVFVDFLEQLTGIAGLIPDPHYSGGGLHQIRRGGFLKVHADFNRLQRLELDRRLNVLLYLNQDWDESFGGDLELWDREMGAAEQVIPPVFNRMVVFATTSTAYHGHPDPLTCPPERARRSIALYYYTNGRPAEEVEAAHSTLFRPRPGETVRRPRDELVRRWVPEGVRDLVRSIRR